MVVTITDDVLTGRDAAIFVSKVDVIFTNDDHRKTIFNPDNANKFLLLNKRIGSKIVIDNVRIVDDALIDSMITPVIE